MGRSIVKLGDYYLEWSTIVDAPVTFGMSLEEFKEYYLAEYGRQGFGDLERRLERVEQSRTSYRIGTLDDLLLCNRAGPDDSELTKVEIYKAYCLQEAIKGGWTVPTVEEETV